MNELLQSPRPVTWLFAGDSITQGAKWLNGFRDFSQHFRERLGELTRNEDVVINTAVGGWGIQSFSQRLEDRVLRYKPDVAFLMFGTNDSINGHEGLASFVETYERCIQLIGKAGIPHIVVQTTLPMWPIDADGVAALGDYPEDLRAAKLHGLQMRLAWIPKYVEATRTVASETKSLLVDHYNAWTAVGGLRGALLDGAVHPNSFGHRLIARTLFRACGMWDERSWTCRLFVPIMSTLD